MHHSAPDHPMTSTTATSGSWARIELTRIHRGDNNVKYRVSVEGNEELRAFLRQTVMLGKVSFFLGRMPLRDLQHRMDGYLTQQAGRTFFPVYRLYELMEQCGYRHVTSHADDSLEISMWRRDGAAVVE